MRTRNCDKMTQVNLGRQLLEAEQKESLLMKRALLSIAAAAGLSLVIAACGNAPSEKAGKTDSTQTAIEDARLVAALSYADWCGSCQTLDPKIQEARESDDIGAAFVTLDYTAKNKDAFFAAADEAGIGAPIREKYAEGVKTGQLLLIDVDDAKIVSVVTKEMSAEEIGAAVKAAASEA